MFSFKEKDYSSRISRTIQEIDSDRDISVVGSDGVSVTINNLWLLSPLVRSVLDTLMKVDGSLIILPGFSSEEIRSGSEILNCGEERELLYFDERTKCLLETLGIDLTHSELVRSCEDDLVPARRRRASSNVQDVKCLFCGRQFYGSISKLKDKLKCHIGNIHYNQEMQEEISIFFDKNNKCNKCGKSYNQECMKRKHLTFNHSYLVDKIMDQVYNSLDSDSGRHSNDEALLQSDHENNDTTMVVDQDNDDIEDFQNQLMIIQDLSDSEEEGDNESHSEATEDQPLEINYQKSLMFDQDFSDEENVGEEVEDEDETISTDEEDTEQSGLAAAQAEVSLISEDLNREIQGKIDEMIELNDKDRNIWSCKFCSRTEIGKFRVRRHAENHLNYSLACPSCSSRFQSRARLQEHFSLSHKVC